MPPPLPQGTRKQKAIDRLGMLLFFFVLPPPLSACLTCLVETTDMHTTNRIPLPYVVGTPKSFPTQQITRRAHTPPIYGDPMALV